MCLWREQNKLQFSHASREFHAQIGLKTLIPHRVFYAYCMQQFLKSWDNKTSYQIFDYIFSSSSILSEVLCLHNTSWGQDRDMFEKSSELFRMSSVLYRSFW